MERLRERAFGESMERLRERGVVYANLSVEEAVVVGQEHNAAAEDHLASKFQDEVHLARNMLKRCTSSMKFSEHADGGDQFQQLLKRVFLIEVGL